MGLRNEIQEELEEQTFNDGRKQIIKKYYTDPDEDIRGLGASILHDKFIGEYEPNAEQKRIMELELENYNLKNCHNND